MSGILANPEGALVGALCLVALGAGFALAAWLDL